MKLQGNRQTFNIKLLILFLSVILFSVQTYGQNNITESKQIKEYEKIVKTIYKDFAHSQKTKIGIKFYKLFEKNKLEKVERLFDKDRYKRRYCHQVVANNYFVRGQRALNAKQYDIALQFFSKSLEHFKYYNFNDSDFRFLERELGLCYVAMHQNEQNNKAYLKNAYDYLKSSNSWDIVLRYGEPFIPLVLSDYETQQLDKILNHLLSYCNECKHTEKSIGYCTTVINHYLKKYDVAKNVKHLKTALKLAKKFFASDKDFLRYRVIELLTSHYFTKDPKKALTYANRIYTPDSKPIKRLKKLVIQKKRQDAINIAYEYIGSMQKKSTQDFIEKKLSVFDRSNPYDLKLLYDFYSAGKKSISEDRRNGHYEKNSTEYDYFFKNFNEISKVMDGNVRVVRHFKKKNYFNSPAQVLVKIDSFLTQYPQTMYKDVLLKTRLHHQKRDSLDQRTMQILNENKANLFEQKQLISNWKWYIKREYKNHPKLDFVDERQREIEDEYYRVLKLPENSSEFLAFTPEVQQEIKSIKSKRIESRREADRREKGREEALSFLKETFLPKDDSSSSSTISNTDIPCFTVLEQDKDWSGNIDFKIRCRDGVTKTVFYSKNYNRYDNGKMPTTYTLKSLSEAGKSACGCR